MISTIIAYGFRVFLATRLHNCPGYHNPDATLGKPAYKGKYSHMCNI